MLSTPFTAPHSGLDIYSATSPVTCPSAFSDAATPAHAEAGGRVVQLPPLL